MKTPITYPDFEKIDLRIGRVIRATAPEWSGKLLRLEVDFGAEIGTRVIFSGIRKWYSSEDVTGKQYPFLINLEPKKMGEEESQGMMIMADAEEKPVLFVLTEAVEDGVVVR